MEPPSLCMLGEGEVERSVKVKQDAKRGAGCGRKAGEQDAR